MCAEASRYVPPVEGDGLRHWQVAGGIIRSDDTILLVKNLRRGGMIDWSTPGGVVDAGETTVEALTREVEEETGLRVGSWRGPIYRVEVHAPDAGFFLEVEAHLGDAVEGAIEIDDPDGIVVDVLYVQLADVDGYLAAAQPWVAEPLLAHLTDGIEDGRTFRYRMTGRQGQERRIDRL